jgi:hypothetical protein
MAKLTQTIVYNTDYGFDESHQRFIPFSLLNIGDKVDMEVTSCTPTGRAMYIRRINGKIIKIDTFHDGDETMTTIIWK